MWGQFLGDPEKDINQLYFFEKKIVFWQDPKKSLSTPPPEGEKEGIARDLCEICWKHFEGRKEPKQSAKKSHRSQGRRTNRAHTLALLPHRQGTCAVRRSSDGGAARAGFL